ncbi:MAG: DUF4199 domain-containing protein [Bacteroidales bacterium]|nr:DUF4199 domain-containing protein [Bacteroidales bacterium]
MTEEREIGQPRSIYHLGASDGLVVGVYMSIMYVLQVTGFNNGMLMLLSQAMLLGLPVVAFVLLRRAYVASRCTSRLSAIWMHGIVIFLCGSLLMGLVAYVYMRVINPDFIVNLFDQVAQIYLGMEQPEMKHIGVTLERLISEKLLPSPISFAFTLIWLGGFLGAIISLIIACILRWGFRKPNYEN